MREIKFRQPINNNGKFESFHYWGILKKGVFVAPLSDARYCDTLSNQFTGLKDKNGKEIYERDVLVSRGSLDIYFLVSFGDDTDKEEFGFTLKALNKTNKIYGFCRDVEKYEIIGNIYENPELLDANQNKPEVNE